MHQYYGNYSIVNHTIANNKLSRIEICIEFMQRLIVIEYSAHMKYLSPTEYVLSGLQVYGYNFQGLFISLNNKLTWHNQADSKVLIKFENGKFRWTKVAYQDYLWVKLKIVTNS